MKNSYFSPFFCTPFAYYICDPFFSMTMYTVQSFFSSHFLDIFLPFFFQFRGLTFGYQKTNGSAVLKSCLEYAMSRHTNFLPGEAGFLLKILLEVSIFTFAHKIDLFYYLHLSIELTFHVCPTANFFINVWNLK